MSNHHIPRGESGVGTWTVIVRDTKINEHNGTWVDWHLKLWGESIDASLAKPLPMPTEEDDDDHDMIMTTTIPPTTVTPPPGFQTPGELPTATPTDHPDRPINTKPTNTATLSTGEEETASSPSPSATEIASSWLPGFLPTFGVSPRTQAWIYASIALILIFCAGLGVYLYMARRRRLRNSPRDNYEFELLDEEEAEGLTAGTTGEKGGAAGVLGGGGGGGGRGGKKRTRGGELYDAFAGGSEDEDEDSGGGGGGFYRDNDEGAGTSSSSGAGSDAAGREKRALGVDDEEHHVLGSDSEDEGDERQGLAAGRR